MKIDAWGKNIARCVASGAAGMAFSFLIMSTPAPGTQEEIMFRCGVVGWGCLVLAALFFGFGWLTEDESS